MMKKMMITLMLLLTTAVAGHAMSYEQARNEALFLTDKMAYELNLTDDQYEAAYEINLDYLMGVTSYDDVYGNYGERRNLVLSYVLFDWQWQQFLAASYFYRPLYWRDGFWHFGIYARYPRRDYFYFGRPVFYASYRGGHAWHVVGGRGWYYTRRDHFRPAGRSHFGMLDRWNRGDFRHHSTHLDSRNHHFGGNRNSSTRTTVNRHQDNNRGYGNIEGRRHNGDNYNNRHGGGRSGNMDNRSGNNRSIDSNGSFNRNGSTGGRGSFNRNGSAVDNGSNGSSLGNGGSRNGSSFGGNRNGSTRSSSSSGSFRSSPSRSSSSASGRQGGGNSSRGGSFGRGR